MIGHQAVAVESNITAAVAAKRAKQEEDATLAFLQEQEDAEVDMLRFDMNSRREARASFYSDEL